MWRIECRGSYNSRSDIHRKEEKQSGSPDANNANIVTENRINIGGLEFQRDSVPREEMINIAFKVYN